MIRVPFHKILTRMACAIGCLSLSLSFQSCGSSAEKGAEDRKQYIIPDSLLKTLKIDTVKMGVLFNSVTLTGQVDFNQDRVINIFPLISGNIQQVKVMLGDYVKEGDVLGIMKSPEMSQYSSELSNAQTSVKLAEMNLEKTSDLYKKGLASRSDSLSAAVALQQAKSELTRSERILQINGNSTTGEFVIKAPISGYVVQKFVTNNQTIRADNGGPLFTISDLKDVWIWANVYESNVANIHQDDPVEVTTLSHPGRTFKGKVDKMMQMLDPASKAMKVRISISNDDYALKPQMFASVTVTNTDNKQALFVPSSALIFDHSQYYVLVYKGNGKADITPVQKLNSIGQKTYLTEGVKAGDRVIASNALLLYSELNN